MRDLRRNADENYVDIDVIGGDAARELPELGGLDALVVDPRARALPTACRQTSPPPARGAWST